MGLADIAIAAVVLSAAGLLLWRSVRNGGRCAGCSGGGCGASDPPVVLRRPPRTGRRGPSPRPAAFTRHGAR